MSHRDEEHEKRRVKGAVRVFATEEMEASSKSERSESQD